VSDYRKSFESVYPVADYIAVNVSSPNTPNLRQLQDKAALDEILAALQAVKNAEGKLDQAKGPAKVTVCRAINDRDLEAEGNADRSGGKVQEGFGTARRKVGEAIEDVGESIRK